MGGRGVNIVPNIPAVITFTLNPRQANTAVPIDYTPTTGIKLFNSTIIKLPDLFDGESKPVNLFNENLAENMNQSGWVKSGANIIIIPDSTGTQRNIITEYGRLVM